MNTSKITSCSVCGENAFTVNAGFYYCNECGTQSQNFQQIEIDVSQAVDSFRVLKKVKSAEIKKEQLTSWECYNYLLCGLVDELIQLGAREELKMTVLQLWTTYLKKSEVAFFNVRHAELPKLGPRFSKRDASILYDYREKQKKRRRGRLILKDGCNHDNKTQGRNWKKDKKLLDASTYTKSEYSQSTKYNSSLSGCSSTTFGTNRAHLNFSSSARKYYKNLMPKSHLNKHAKDFENNLQCHTLHNNKSQTKKKFHGLMLTRQTIYSLLYLGLNLTEDGIQLADFLRFMREEHISTLDIKKFFPDNIAEDCVKVIKSKQHYGKAFYPSESIRKQSVILCRFIHIPELNLPDLKKLAERYVYDLNLPNDIAVYVNRLISIYPPQMKFKLQDQITPCYEGRAMAYIIFVLKLLFGLDGNREKLISSSAQNINKELLKISPQSQKLFVWTDWVRFIEMRNILITQCYLPSSLHQKQNINQDQYLNDLKMKNEICAEEYVNQNRPALLAFETIFQKIYDENNRRKAASIPSMKFPPSMTPTETYLKLILNDPQLYDKLFIPNFVSENHTEYDVNSYLSTKSLKNIFRKNRIKLIVNRIPCDMKKNFVGVGRNKNICNTATTIRVRQADFNVPELEWVEMIKSKTEDNTLFKKGYFSEPEKDDKSTKRKRSRVSSADETLMDTIRKLRRKQNKNVVMESPANLSKSTEKLINSCLKKDLDYVSINSFDVFSELDMKPLPDFADNPRTNLEEHNILDGISDADEDYDNDIEAKYYDEELEFKTTNFDYWVLLAQMHYLTNVQHKELESKLPDIMQWLLKVCADLIEIEFKDLYDELLIIENFFAFAVEPMDSFKNILKFNTMPLSFDSGSFVDSYKSYW